MRKIIGFIGLYTCVAAAAFMPKFQSAGKVKCNGANITGITFATMFVADWDGDGKKDLLVGEFSPNAKVRLYTNVGTNKEPVFNSYAYLQAAGADIKLSSG